MCSCDWQKQQYFSQMHCASGLSHCEQTVVNVIIPPPKPQSAFTLE
jgi:hypothetical protein